MSRNILNFQLLTKNIAILRFFRVKLTNLGILMVWKSWQTPPLQEAHVYCLAMSFLSGSMDLTLVKGKVVCLSNFLCPIVISHQWKREAESDRNRICPNWNHVTCVQRHLCIAGAFPITRRPTGRPKNMIACSVTSHLNWKVIWKPIPSLIQEKNRTSACTAVFHARTLQAWKDMCWNNTVKLNASSATLHASVKWL